MKTGINTNKVVLIINKKNKFSHYKKSLIMGDKLFLKDIKILIENFTNNKTKEYEEIIIKKYNFKGTYTLKSPILCRYFLIKAIEEINKALKKDNKKFRIDFNEDSYKYFNKKDHKYFKNQGCVTDNDVILVAEIINEMNNLELVIKENNNDKKCQNFILKT